jgi:hypothetical protein
MTARRCAPYSLTSSRSPPDTVTDAQPPFDILSGNIYEAFAANVHDWLGEFAALKRIDITRWVAERMADRVANGVALQVPFLFMRDDPATQAAVTRRICDALDLRMAEMFADLYVDTFGRPSRPHVFTHLVRAMLALLPTGPVRDTKVWPPLVVASLVPHLDRRTDHLFTDWGEVSTITYNRGFVLDRPSAHGPALECFHHDGCHDQEYWRDGVLHRDCAEGPAMIARARVDGPIISQHYIVDGQPHRPDGPASIWSDFDGAIIDVAYYIEGQRIGEDEFLRRHAAADADAGISHPTGGHLIGTAEAAHA